MNVPACGQVVQLRAGRPSQTACGLISLESSLVSVAFILPLGQLLLSLLLLLLVAVLPNIVNNQIRNEMYKGTDPTVETQFNKLYVYPMDNVSILFADIKVSQVN